MCLKGVEYMECPVCKSNNTVESKLTTGLSFVVVTSIDTKVPTKRIHQ